MKPFPRFRINSSRLPWILGTETESRLTAWDQAIKLAPTSDRILDAIDTLLTPQLAPETGAKAIASLAAARVPGLAEKLIAIRGTLGPKLTGEILTLLLARADTTTELLQAIADGKAQFTELQLDQRQALVESSDSRDLHSCERVDGDERCCRGLESPSTGERVDARHGIEGRS